MSKAKTNGWRKEEKRDIGSLTLRRCDGTEFLGAPVSLRKAEPGTVLRSAPPGPYEHLFVVALFSVQMTGVTPSSDDNQTAWHIGSYNVQASPQQQVRIDARSIAKTPFIVPFRDGLQLSVTHQEKTICDGIQRLIDKQVDRIERVAEKMAEKASTASYEEMQQLSLSVMQELAVALAMNNLRLHRVFARLNLPAFSEMTYVEWKDFRVMFNQSFACFRQLVRLMLDPVPIERNEKKVTILPMMEKAVMSWYASDESERSDSDQRRQQAFDLTRLLRQAFKSIFMSHLNALKESENYIDVKCQSLQVVGARDPSTGRASVTRPKFFIGGGDIMASDTFWPSLTKTIETYTAV